MPEPILPCEKCRKEAVLTGFHTQGTIVMVCRGCRIRLESTSHASIPNERTETDTQPPKE